LRKPPAKRRKSPSGASDTAARIVDRAILLFNRHGVQNVSIERIAMELKISPGNLTYHFKRKRDLVLATQSVLQKHLHEALARPIAVTSPNEGGLYIVRVFQTLWDFRFFFNGLAFLLTDDAPLRAKYEELLEGVIGTIESDMIYLYKRGYMVMPRSPNSFRLLAENLWGQWLTWLRITQIKDPQLATPRKSALFEGSLHLWSLCEPFMHSVFADELLKVFENLLLPKATPLPRHKTSRA
jgi:AcrR family transcriptional regulator